MPNRFTTAYAGSGTITPENAKFHLDQFLPEDPEPGVSALGLVIVPEHVARKQAGLKHVIAWLDGELGKDAVARASKLVEALLDRREYEEDGETYTDDLVLVMLYDESVEEDVALAQRAHDAGIRVVDLCAAGDDLLLEKTDLFPADPETGLEAPPFEGGTVIGSSDDGPTEAERAATGSWDENPAARAIRQATDAGVAAAEAVREAAPTVEVASPAQGFSVALTLSQEAVNALADAILLAMDRQASEADVRLGTTGSAAEKLPADHYGVPSEGDPAPAGTRPYYYSSDSGLYRPARGKARDKERKVYLAEAEVREITQHKLLA